LSVTVPGNGVTTLLAVRTRRCLVQWFQHAFTHCLVDFCLMEPYQPTPIPPPSHTHTHAHVRAVVTPIPQFASDVAGNEDESPAVLRVAIAKPPSVAFTVAPPPTASSRSIVLQAAVRGHPAPPFLSPAITIRARSCCFAQGVMGQGACCGLMTLHIHALVSSAQLEPHSLSKLVLLLCVILWYLAQAVSMEPGLLQGIAFSELPNRALLGSQRNLQLRAGMHPSLWLPPPPESLS
jgi:hypothetical protein